MAVFIYSQLAALGEKSESLEGRLSDTLGELSTLQNHYDDRGRENDEAKAHAHEAKQGWDEERRTRVKRSVSA